MRKALTRSPVFAALFLLVLLSACGGGAQSPGTTGGGAQGGANPPAPASSPQGAGEESAASSGGMGEIIPVYSPGSGGTAYLFAAGIAQVLNESGNFPGIQFNAEGTSGATEIVQLMIQRGAEGKGAIGLLSSDTVYDVYHGQMKNVEGEHKEIQALGYLYGAEVYMAVPKESPIVSYADLKGKKVGIGAAGSGVANYNTKLLEYYGLTANDYSPLPLGYSEVVEGLQNGSIDAGSLGGSTPVAAYSELSNSKDVRILPVDQEILDKFLADNPFYAPTVIKPGTYKGLDKDVTVAGFGVTITVLEGMEEEAIYQVTKTLMENAEELKKVYPSADMTPETVTRTVGVPFHPGAEKYLVEYGIETGS